MKKINNRIKKLFLGEQQIWPELKSYKVLKWKSFKFPSLSPPFPLVWQRTKIYKLGIRPFFTYIINFNK